MTQTVPGTSGAVPQVPALAPLLTANGVAMPTPTPFSSWRTPSWVTPTTPAARPDAEYSIHDPNFFRDDDWRFGHDAHGTYHLERSQQGRVVRTASGTAQSNPALVEGVRRLEQLAARSEASGGSHVQPGDFRGYYGSRHDSYYRAGEFISLDDRTTNRRTWILQGNRAEVDLTAGLHELDRRTGETVAGTDGGEVGGWEKVGKVAGTVGLVVALVGAGLLLNGGRGRIR